MPVGYGKSIRERETDAKKRSAMRYKCPSCSRTSVKRKSYGLWECRKCGVKFASASYEFRVK